MGRGSKRMKHLYPKKKKMARGERGMYDVAKARGAEEKASSDYSDTLRRSMKVRRK